MLLVEDDPGDVVRIREAFEHNIEVVRQIDDFFVSVVKLPHRH